MMILTSTCHAAPRALVAAGFLLGAFFGSAQEPPNLYKLNLGAYPGSGTNARSNPGIASGSPSGFYIRMAEDAAALCSRPLDPAQTPFRLNVVATEGGLDSVKRLRREGDVQLAIAQSDLQFYAKQLSDASNPNGAWLSAKSRESWLEIAEDTRLVLPLYTEKIHIVVTPTGKAQFQDLMGLFRNKARVSVGTAGSGSMVTCSLIEDMILREMRARNEPANRWKAQYLGADEALDRLVRPDGELDAVILIGGVPFPALDKFTLRQIRSGFTTKTTADLALLPFGKEADAALDNDPNFKGYVRTTIKADDYRFLAGGGDIATRGVTACLVTHESFSADPKSSESLRKMQWVRHVTFRILASLDQSSQFGLAREFGKPQGDELWKEVWGNLKKLESGDQQWAAYGWQRHDDPVLKTMVDSWARSYQARPSGRGVIDPDR